MTAGYIVKKARNKLGDANKTGWDDTILIDFVDQAQKDLCKSARIYKRIHYLGILNYETRYPLPDDCFQIDRVEYKGEPLSVLSREDQDNRYEAKGLHIIKSDINMDNLEISEVIEELDAYPSYVEGNTIISSEIAELTPALGVTGHAEGDEALEFPIDIGVISGFTLDPLDTPRIFGDVSGFAIPKQLALVPNDQQSVGFITELDFGFADDSENCGLGFLTRVANTNAVGTYGVCTDVLSIGNYLKIYYSAIPRRIDSLYSALIVPDIWEKALIHYVVGTARQDDNDEGNYQLGEMEMMKYEREVKKAIKLTAKNYVSGVGEIKETTYRRV